MPGFFKRLKTKLSLPNLRPSRLETRDAPAVPHLSGGPGPSAAGHNAERQNERVPVTARDQRSDREHLRAVVEETRHHKAVKSRMDQFLADEKSVPQNILAIREYAKDVYTNEKTTAATMYYVLGKHLVAEHLLRNATNGNKAYANVELSREEIKSSPSDRVFEMAIDATKNSNNAAMMAASIHAVFKGKDAFSQVRRMNDLVAIKELADSYPVKTDDGEYNPHFVKYQSRLENYRYNPQDPLTSPSIEYKKRAAEIDALKAGIKNRQIEDLVAAQTERAAHNRNVVAQSPSPHPGLPRSGAATDRGEGSSKNVYKDLLEASRIASSSTGGSVEAAPRSQGQVSGVKPRTF